MKQQPLWKKLKEFNNRFGPIVTEDASYDLYWRQLAEFAKEEILGEDMVAVRYSRPHKCKYKNCKYGVWLGVCNEYCTKHHQRLCIGSPKKINNRNP